MKPEIFETLFRVWASTRVEGLSQQREQNEATFIVTTTIYFQGLLHHLTSFCYFEEDARGPLKKESNHVAMAYDVLGLV